MLKRLLNFLPSTARAPEIRLCGTPVRLLEPFHVANAADPIRLELNGQPLSLHPERRLGVDSESTGDWILVDADRYGEEVTGFARLAAGQTLLVGRDNDMLARLCRFGPGIAARQLNITNTGDGLTFTPLDGAAKTTLSAIQDPDRADRVSARRLQNLRRVREIYGGPICLLPTDIAQATLDQVNALLAWDGLRRKDRAGRPGGLLTPAPNLTPIIVGDLHAQVDNLLRVLSENGFLAALERGTAYLLLLGDAIHPEEDGELEEMDSSILILDLIFKLMVRFPDNVFYVRGNHESFSEEVSKGGVPQGRLFRQRVRKLRGERYAQELERFFELLPYVVVSGDFAACHGGPAQTRVMLDDIVDIHARKELAMALTWIRPRRPGGYAGFTRRDVESFRRNLGLASDAAVIVAHTPLTSDESCWNNANGIPNHHIVFSAHRQAVGVFVRLGGRLTALELRAEPLLNYVNLALEPADGATLRQNVA